MDMNDEPQPLRRSRKAKRMLEAPMDFTVQEEAFDVPTDGVDVEELDRLTRQKAESDRERRVASIANEVQGNIQLAVSSRDGSSVEARWKEDLTYYYGSEKIAKQVQGVIDAALNEKARATQDGERLTRSTISVNITRPKVNAAFARLSDMLLPVDDRNFGIEPTPVPDLVPGGAQGKPTDLVAGPGGTVGTQTDMALQRTETAKAAAKLMQKEIDDNLTECDFASEARKMLFQAVCLGTGVIHGPVAARREEKAWVKGANEEWKLERKPTLVPETRWVDLFNFYPDPACGGEIKNARFVVEREEYNARMLRELRDQPGYITENIDRILTQKPMAIQRMKSETLLVDGGYRPADQDLYEVFHYTGELTKGALCDMGVEAMGGYEDQTDEAGRVIERLPMPCPQEERQEAVSCVVVMCHGQPIKAYLNPIRSGDLGYHTFQYEPVHGQVFGIGVAYLIRSPQRVLSTAWRMVMDNAAFTVGGIIVMNRTSIVAADGDDSTIYGGKLYYATEGLDDGAKVEDAFKIFQMDSQLEALEKIITLAMKFAEDETSLPSLMEGNQGAAPDTVGGMTLLMNSANTVLKLLAKRFDDSITRPHINAYYEWHMLYNSKNELKGDFNVMARGSSHLVVRDLQRQSLVGFMQYSTLPQYAPFFKRGGFDALRKVAESNYLTPDDVLVTETEADAVWQRLQQAQGQGDGRAAAEQAKLTAMASEGEKDRAHEMQMKSMERDMMMMKFANDNQMQLADVKAMLASKVMEQRHETALQNKEAGIKAVTGTGL